MRRMRNVYLPLWVGAYAYAHVCVRVWQLVPVRCFVMLNPFEKLSNPIRSCRSIKVFERNIA